MESLTAKRRVSSLCKRLWRQSNRAKRSNFIRLTGELTRNRCNRAFTLVLRNVDVHVKLLLRKAVSLAYTDTNIARPVLASSRETVLKIERDLFTLQSRCKSDSNTAQRNDRQVFVARKNSLVKGERIILLHLQTKYVFNC